jgi:hypothetical protein
MNRRRLLKTGIGALGVLTGGAGMLAYRYLPPTPSTQLRPPDQIARDLLATLDPELKSRLQVDYDHAYRQYHNRGVWAGGVNVATGGFSRNQLSLIVDLMHSGLSAQGRQIIPNQLLLKLPDAVVNNLLICGEPGSAHCQILFTGPHLNLRIGGSNREGVAFGGPQVYGDQSGNKEAGLPGNVYQPQFVAGMALFDALDTEQQALALQPDSPIQTRIEVQGAGGVFAGVPVAEMTPIQQNLAKRMIDLTFAPYPQEDVAYAWQCLEANGGLSSLHAAFYEDSRYDGRGGFQTYRLEGPSAVFYFRGFPHVHAFFNVAMDGEAPLSVGESLGHNPAVLEGPSLAALFERAMRHHSGADFGYYDPDSAVGRLRAGNVRSGDVYTAESWENQVVELNIKGAEITGGLAAGLAARGERLQPQRTYRVATVDFVADELLETAIGPASRVGESGLLRDQVIGYLRAEGFTG